MAVKVQLLCVAVLVSNGIATDAKQPAMYSSSYSSYSSSTTSDKDGKMHTTEERSESSTSSDGNQSRTVSRKVHCVDGDCKDQKDQKDQKAQASPPMDNKSQGFLEKAGKTSGDVASEMDSQEGSIREEADKTAAQMESSFQSMERRMHDMEKGMHQEFGRMFRPIHAMTLDMPKMMEPLSSSGTDSTWPQWYASKSSNSASESMHEVWDGKNGQFRATKRTTRCKGEDCVTEEVEVTPKATDQK